uniref:Uncharacterized protein n=1 Tax=Anguilla anguilla TaxID=7936 RepID=A0A0E9QRK5_ANGAN
MASNLTRRCNRHTNDDRQNNPSLIFYPSENSCIFTIRI